MVHAADLRIGIANAGGDARAENCGEYDVGIVGDAKFALNHMYAAFARHVRPHPNRPTTASMEAFSVATVNGLARKLCKPYFLPCSMMALSPRPVTRMKAAFFVGSYSRTARSRPRPSSLGMLRSE